MHSGEINERSAPAPRSVAMWLLAIVIGAVLLRVWARVGQAVWFDEAFSWRLAAYPCGELLRRASLDNNPPLYYLLLKGWTTLFGDSPIALSSLSIVLGGLACAGMFGFVLEAYQCEKAESTRPMYGGDARWLALFTAALLATSGLQVYWGTQIRMYALFAALAIASSWLLLRAMHARGRALCRWLAYALLTLLLAYCHTYALFTIAAQAVYVAASILAGAAGKLGLPQDRRLPGALLAAVVLTIGWLPWLPAFLRQQAQVRDAFWLPPLTWWDVRHTWHMLTAVPSLANTGTIHSVMGVACLAGVLLLFWRPRPADRLVVLSAVVPLAAGILISTFDRNILSPRYLIAAQPFVLLGGARLALAIGNVRVRTAVASLVILLNVALNRDVASGGGRALPSGIRAAAQYVDATRTADSPVIGTCPLVFLPLTYHLRGPVRGHLVINGKPIPHFEGRAVFKDDELLTARQLEDLGARQVFVIGNTCHFGHQSGEIAIPKAWRLIRQAEFEDTGGISSRLNVAEYRIVDARLN